MKKIGILTYHNSINYGSVMQSFALSKFLNLQGYNVEIIDYKPKNLDYIYRLYNRSLKPKSIAKNILVCLPISKIYKKRIKEFGEFNRKYLPISKEQYYFDDDFEVLNGKYDILLCGSDQIWNTCAIDCDPIYFLPIKHKARKISYAASMGHDDYCTNEKCGEEFKKNLNDFDVISVREKSGCEKIEKYLNNGKVINNDIDPTLLLDRKYFEEVQSERIVDEDYIFMFSVKYSKETLAFAKLIAEKTGLKVYSLMTQQGSYKFVKFDKSYVTILPDKLNPSDFLSYFQHAKYTFSDSFHGVAFSIIYNKNFYAINEMRKNGKLANDERIVNILSHLGLEDRYISKDEFEKIDISKMIDYSKVNNKLDKLRKESKERLIRSIEGK